jgi:hypothetical protein
LLDDNAKAKLRRLMEARQRRDEDKKAAEASEAEYRDCEADVYEALQESDVQGTIKVDLGDPWGTVSFRTRETLYGRIIDEDKALEYFNQRAMTDEVTTPKFAKKRINEIVRDMHEQGLDMPPGVDYYPNRGVTITRQK